MNIKREDRVPEIAERKSWETTLENGDSKIEKLLIFNKTLLSAVPLPVFYKDREGRYIGCSKAFTEVMGVTEEEICGKTVVDLWPSELAKTYHAKDLELMNAPQRQVYEFRIKDKNGTVRPVIYAKDIFRDETGEVAGIVGAFQDISILKEMEESLRKSEEKYRSLVENVNIGVYRNSGADGRFLSINPAMLSIFGYASPEEFLNITAEDLYQNASDRNAFLQVVKTRGFVKDHELSLKKKDGTPILCSATVTSHFDADGKLAWLDGVVEDITERKSAEKAVKTLNEELERRVLERTKQLETANSELKAAQSRILQQEKMASIGQLAAGVAHEINNPMSFIMSNLGSLQHYMVSMVEFIKDQDNAFSRLAAFCPEEAKVLEEMLRKQKAAARIDHIIEDVPALLKESREGADRVKQIVQNLKTFAHVGESLMKITDINACLENTIKVAWNELKYKASVKKEYGTIPQIMCNPGEINQVFLNMLLNAAQAIEKNGTIEIKTSCDAENIYISISDNGSGIAAKNLRKIFEPFFTTKDVGKGTGLGLSISYDIVKNHNGRIDVESKVGEGTKFTIALPIVGAG